MLNFDEVGYDDVTLASVIMEMYTDIRKAHRAKVAELERKIEMAEENEKTAVAELEKAKLENSVLATSLEDKAASSAYWFQEFNKKSKELSESKSVMERLRCTIGGAHEEEADAES